MYMPDMPGKKIENESLNAAYKFIPYLNDKN